MAAMFTETPSRIWRRIEAVEDHDMPSLPSLPGFEDDDEDSEPSLEMDTGSDRDADSDGGLQSAVHSTPALSSHHSSIASRTTSSTSSSQRFATSLARSRASQGSRAASKNRSFSFDVSPIPSLPEIRPEHGTYHFSKDDESNVVQHDDDDDDDISDALQSLSRSNSPVESTPKKHFDIVVPLRSEPKPSPLDPYRNISLRRPLGRTRTPSLSRTTMSPPSSPANSTPQSTRNRSLAESPMRAQVESPAGVALARSSTNSPQIRPENSDSLSVDFSDRVNDSDTQSMDITEAHISPIRDLPVQVQEQTEEANESAEQREPTFSSEGDNTPFAARYVPQTSPLVAPSGNSSIAQSVAFTPTPAFPRPRARFNMPSQPDLLTTPSQRASSEEVEDPLTPHTRRKSFLLSIVNSTTRPRMKMPTPHPRHKIDLANATPGLSNEPGTAMNLQSAFGGATPLSRPRIGRQSHPLAQGFTASDSDSDTTTSPSGAPVRKLPLRRISLGTSPAGGYDVAMDRASFVSTASSHDLTTNIRANTSFDPAMGFGVGAQATGRFNAGKLNTYLHGLNRRLQEENEILIQRLKDIEEERRNGDGMSEGNSSRRQSGGYNRRLSAGPAGLVDVQEDVGGEGWVTEKVELEEMVEVYKDEVEKYVIEREELEKALGDEQRERARDQERYKGRMAEVEQGVEGIINDLENKLNDAEARAKKAQEESLHRAKELELQVDAFRAEKDLAIERAAKAERALSSGKDLGGELKDANQRVSNLMSDMRNSNAQLREMEEEATHADERIDELEKIVEEERGLVKELEKELNIKMDELDAETDKLRQTQNELNNVNHELQATKEYVAELETAAKQTFAQFEALDQELETAKKEAHQLKAEVEDAERRIAALKVETEQSAELARQMEDALDAAEQKMTADDEQIAKLKTQAATLERERDRRVLEPSRSIAPTIDNADLEALEDELDEAHREIARLNTIMNSTPVRKTMDKAKDMRIEMLERENEALSERIKAWKYNTSEMGATPSKLLNGSTLSPAQRQMLSFNLRTPRTPGGPLKDLTWLHSTTADGEFSPLIAEISRLHHELDRANESVDDKLDKLEDAGLGVVSLTRKLEDSRARIVALEEEIARLSRKEDRRARRLEKLRCQKCLTKVRLPDGNESTMEISRSMASEPPTPPTRTSEALKANLRSVNSQLSSMKKDWEKERQQLVSEKAVLQEVANKLNDKIRTATEEAAKASQTEKTGQALRGDIQSDLDRAKRTIADLEDSLKAERAQLRMFTVEQTRVSQERENVLVQLRRTESDMEDVKQQLQQFKKENHAMEKELRENANVEQKARLLEERVAENVDTIDQLRQERSLLATEHKALQNRFTDVSEQANRLRDEYASSQMTHDNRRHQLDLHMSEIDELRRALSDQAEDLHRAEAEKKRLSSERSEVVAALQADLKRVKKDAEAFGRDLKTLRSEKERNEQKQKDDLVKAQRGKKQADAQIRLLTEQVDAQKLKVVKYKDQFEKHVCAIDEGQLSVIKLQHNKECKGLIVQIRYLKVKFSREATLRFDLVYQKQYLMALLGRLEKSEQTIFAAISKIGFPVKPPPVVVPQRRKFKSVAMMVLFMARIRRASKEWQKQCDSKEAIAVALQDVRKRRLAHSGI